MKVWHIYRLTWAGDHQEIVATFHNKGQALSALRGLRARAQRARSELNYALVDATP